MELTYDADSGYWFANGYFDNSDENYVPGVFTVKGTDKDGKEKRETRTVMHFRPALAPFKCAVLPLVKKLTPKAEEVYDMLSKKFMVDFDEAGTIGKRYRRQDEIGTPFCITYDFDTLEKDNCVTVRDRDTMQQERVAIDDLVAYLEAKMVF